jgi:hypothetical protein
MQKMLPGASFELQPLTPKQTDAMKSRLSDSQHTLVKNLGKNVNASVKKNASAFRLQLPGDQRMAVSANAKGVLKFDPQISKVKKPLGGGIGPVGVTVGVGIAGKF